MDLNRVRNLSTALPVDHLETVMGLAGVRKKLSALGVSQAAGCTLGPRPTRCNLSCLCCGDDGGCRGTLLVVCLARCIYIYTQSSHAGASQTNDLAPDPFFPFFTKAAVSSLGLAAAAPAETGHARHHRERSTRRHSPRHEYDWLLRDATSWLRR